LAGTALNKRSLVGEKKGKKRQKGKDWGLMGWKKRKIVGGKSTGEEEGFVATRKKEKGSGREMCDGSGGGKRTGRRREKAGRGSRKGEGGGKRQYLEAPDELGKGGKNIGREGKRGRKKGEYRTKAYSERKKREGLAKRRKTKYGGPVSIR